MKTAYGLAKRSTPTTHTNVLPPDHYVAQHYSNDQTQIKQK